MNKRNGVQRRKIERISSSKSKARIAASAAFVSLIFVYWRLVSTLILENQVDSIERRDPILLNQAYRRPKTNNTLEFVHITKTGGTAIERAAARINIPWGVCHFVPKEHCLGVKPDLGFPYAFPLKRDIPFQGKFSKAEYWHTPPHWFVDNPFEGKDSFVVVRNPYDRYISEFYCRYYGYRRKERLGTTNWNPSDRVARFQHLTRQKEAFQAVKRKNIQRAQHKTAQTKIIRRRSATKCHFVQQLVAAETENIQWSYWTHASAALLCLRCQWKASCHSHTQV